MEEPKYAGFWIRVGAYLLDLALICVIDIGPFLWLYSLIPRIVRLMAVPIVALILPLLYFSLFESSKFQATPGKMACGLKVTTMDGERISVLRGFGRTLSRVVAGWVTLQIGYLMVAFTQKKQGLHDFMASTLVVFKNS